MPEQHSLKFYQADVFTSQPFGGNPVAVFPDASGLLDEQLQKIAREMNLSETVFVFPPRDPAAVVRLRIFTPTQEIPFAGHPVIGAMHVLAQIGTLVLAEAITHIVYECNIGIFPAELHACDGQVIRIIMTQPQPQFLEKVEDTETLYMVAGALGISNQIMTEAKWPVQGVSTGLPVLIVPVRTLTEIRSIIPNDKAIVDLCSRFGTNGIMVFTTVTVEPYANVHARMFAPVIGISEDPATGSAGGALGAYLVENGVVEISPKTDIIIEQGYEIYRPSSILVQIELDDEIIQSIKVVGQCVIVAEGVLKF